MDEQAAKPVAKRRWLQFSLAMLLVLTAAIGLMVAILTSTPRHLYHEIAIGMNSSEVEAILGDSGQEIAPLTYVDVEIDEQRERLLASWPHTHRNWIRGSHMISVLFDPNNRVVAKYYKRSPDAGALTRFLDASGR